jgi:tyrosine-protein phosphatase YwqE
VIAHPERYRNHDEQLTSLAKFRAAGAVFQLNAGSLFGDYGGTAAAHARTILALGWADYVSSDYHARGEPGLRRFANALDESGLSEQAELLLVVNPARLLAGEPPLAVPAMESAQEQARPFWARLLDQAWPAE